MLHSYARFGWSLNIGEHLARAFRRPCQCWPLAPARPRPAGSKTERRYDAVRARLTQCNKRAARGSHPLPTSKRTVSPNRICHGCGKELVGDSMRCKSCSTEIMTEQRDAAGRLARTAAQSSEAQLKRAATQQINALAQHAWKPSDPPSWLTPDFYSEKIRPALMSLRGSVIARRLKVSCSYANGIRKGLRPHPRHWKTLADIVGFNQL